MRHLSNIAFILFVVSISFGCSGLLNKIGLGGLSESDQEKFFQSIEFLRMGDESLAMTNFKYLCDTEKSQASCVFSSRPRFSSDIRERHLKRLSISQGHSTESSVTLNTYEPDGRRYHYIFQNLMNGELISSDHIDMRIHRTPGARGRVRHFFVDSLNAGVRYRMIVISDRAELVDVRDFFTFPHEGRRMTIGLISNLMESGNAASSFWMSLQSHNLDMVIALGAGVNGVVVDRDRDFETLKWSYKLIWDQYAELRQRLNFFFWPKLKPLYISWSAYSYHYGIELREEDYFKVSREVFSWIFEDQELKAKVYSRSPRYYSQGHDYSLILRGQKLFFLSEQYPYFERLNVHQAELLGLDASSNSDEELSLPGWLILSDSILRDRTQRAYFSRYLSFRPWFELSSLHDLTLQQRMSGPPMSQGLWRQQSKDFPRGIFALASDSRSKGFITRLQSQLLDGGSGVSEGLLGFENLISFEQKAHSYILLRSLSKEKSSEITLEYFIPRESLQEAQASYDFELFY